MVTLLLNLYAYGSLMGLMVSLLLFGPETVRFLRDEFGGTLLLWWQTKGAAIILHQLGLWLFFLAFCALVWLLDSAGLIWY